MQLRVFKTLWGSPGSLAEAVAACAPLVFAGIEGQAPALPRERSQFRERLRDSGLDFTAEICTAGSYVPDRQASVGEHLESLRRLAESALECRPLFLTVIAGCDAWTTGQSVEFFGAAIEIGRGLNIELSFETHRSRSLFNPWTARDILLQLEALKLTCDYSHWCVVCERLMDSEPEVLELCAGRAHHVHARVGYDQGPQVPHPAAPEYAGALAAHEGWWRQIWQSQRARGLAITTLTPEFGPDGYLHTLPFTKAPVADLAEVNLWMTQRQKQHFEDFTVAYQDNVALGKVDPG